MRRTAALTAFALIAFAGNSLLARAALGGTAMAPADFTLLRLLAGAAILLPLSAFLHGPRAAASGAGPIAALALLVYAAAFSFAYRTLETGAGALILFATVQATMIFGSMLAGRYPTPLQWAGMALALLGLAWFLSPGVGAPDLDGALLMTLAGIAWGVYSLRPPRSGRPLSATAGNFALAALIALPILLPARGGEGYDGTGVLFALLSGALASGLGYAVWYAALARLAPLPAAVSQLAVPLLAALAGILFLGERADPRLLLATPVILAGIALVAVARR